MANDANTSTEIIKIITDFLSGNFGYILLFTLLVICRQAISGLIGRLTNFKWKKGDSEIGVEAASPQSQHEPKRLGQADELPSDSTDIQERSVKKEAAQEQEWLSKMFIAFDEGRIDDAKSIFKEYETHEKDPIELEENKALFLYLLFEKGKDNNAIPRLEKLVNSSTSEESKYNALTWLSICLQNGLQTKADVNLWKKYAKTFTTNNLITGSIIHLAQSLNRDGTPIEAKKAITIQLEKVSDSSGRADLYEALSETEKELGNKKLAVYCKDKSQELKPNNRSELFTTAYQASEEGVDELSISNYITLLKIDADNSIALNNLGVKAQEGQLKTKAVENYKKSASHENTLAMANQGFLLLNAGFVEEAKEIAEKALKIEKPHENVYSLLSGISELQKDDNEKWNKLVNTCIVRQKFIRLYTHAYYEGDIYSHERGWTTKNGAEVDLMVTDLNLEAKWKEQLIGSANIFNVEIRGQINKAAFQGRYTKTKEGEPPEPIGLLGMSRNKNIECIGIFSDGGTSLTIVAEDYSKDLLVELRRDHA